MADNGCMFARALCQYPVLAWHSRDEFSPFPPLASLEAPIFPQGQNSFCHLDCASPVIPLLGLCSHSKGQDVVQSKLLNLEQYEEAE